MAYKKCELKHLMKIVYICGNIFRVNTKSTLEYTQNENRFSLKPVKIPIFPGTF